MNTTLPKGASASSACGTAGLKLKGMWDKDAWLEVAHNLMSHPLRATLTGLSVALGMFILVVMQGLGFGLKNGVEQQFSDDAVNSIWVNTGRTQLPYKGHQSNRRVKLNNLDVPGLFAKAYTVPDFSRRIRMWGVVMIPFDKNGKTEMGSFGIRGLDPVHLQPARIPLAQGRFLH